MPRTSSTRAGDDDGADGAFPFEHFHGQRVSRPNAERVRKVGREHDAVGGQRHGPAVAVDDAPQVRPRFEPEHGEALRAVLVAQTHRDDAKGLGAQNAGQARQLVGGARRAWVGEAHRRRPGARSRKTAGP